MLKRIKKIWDLGNAPQELIGERYRMIKENEALSSPNGVFFDEGSTKELEELKKIDDGTSPWYKRILRHE